ncbi:hypothetical protein Emin_0465 [Elusimicrobium minutum Pei191]|uniref:Uncharacterized protein n=1 Tax=Elusimicrobium minutum (strain Pei191) TaxID=445932 RepID=B2KBK0_ELUMP|nr:hypothetical protein [Elusimicrobium minutum]ACC98022.1 hypothetical protein Emin_0465 [Elusimicrobium minutum Pei191]
MKNKIEDIFECKEVDYGDSKGKWIVFKEDFLQAKKDFIVFVLFQKPKIFQKILFSLCKDKSIKWIENFNKNLAFSESRKLEINNEAEFSKFYNEFRLNYYEYNLFYSEDEELYILMDDDDNFHVLCHKDTLRKVFDLEFIFANDAMLYETFNTFKGYHQIVLNLYSKYFFSKRITIDDFRIIDKRE